MFVIFVKGDVNWVDVTNWLLVYLSAFMMNRRALFCAFYSLYLALAVKELRGTGGYVKAGRIVVLYSLSLLC